MQVPPNLGDGRRPAAGRVLSDQQLRRGRAPAAVAIAAAGAATGAQWLLHVGYPRTPFAPFSLGVWIIRHAPAGAATTAIEHLGHNALRVLAWATIAGAFAVALVLRRVRAAVFAAVAAGLTIAAVTLDPMPHPTRWTLAAAAVASAAAFAVEGNHYFPPDSVRWQHLDASAKHSVCPWKGTASYYDVVVDGVVNRNAAWTYEHPSAAASGIAGYVAFWHGVRVTGRRPQGHRRRALPFPFRRHISTAAPSRSSS